MLAEWSGLATLRAELQVRTVLQHAWAAVSHKLQYKREDDIPVQLRRKLFRLSALFELADDEFISLRSASGEVVRSIKSQLGAGNQDLPIDIVSLSELLSSSPAVAEVDAAAAEVGFTFGSPDGEDDDDSSAISDLVHLCALAGIRTIAAFESMVEAAKPWVDRYLNAQFNADGKGDDWYVTTPFVCQLLLIGSEVEKLRVGHLYMLRWNRDIASRVFRIAQTFRTEA
jgi:putative GTP pyrophosphokinase